jgi:hypothetical protein
MSLASTFFNAVNAAIAANPNLAASTTSAITSAETTFQSQVGAAVTPASNAVSAAAALMPQFKFAVSAGNADAIKSIAEQVMGIPSQTNDIKQAAEMVVMMAGDSKLAAFAGSLEDTVAADVVTQGKLTSSFGLTLPTVF